MALRRVGLDVEVLERAPDVRPVGAGLTVQVNGMRLLEALGLARAVLGARQRLEGGWMARADGSCPAGFEPLAAELVRATDAVMRHDLFDFAPTDRWTRGQ